MTSSIDSQLETPAPATPGKRVPLPARSSANKDWLRAIELTTTIATSPSRLLADVIAARADHAGDRPALLSDRESFSYRALTQRVNQNARWAIANGVGVGDT